MLLFFRSAGITWDKGSRPLLTPQVDPPLEAMSSAQQVSIANTSPEGYKILSFASGAESGRKMLPSLQLHDMIQPSITQVTSNGYFVLELRKTAVNVGGFSPCVLAGQITIHWRPHAREFGLPSVKAIPGTVGGLTSDAEPVHTRRIAGAVSPNPCWCPLGTAPLRGTCSVDSDLSQSHWIVHKRSRWGLLLLTSPLHPWLPYSQHPGCLAVTGCPFIVPPDVVWKTVMYSLF